MCGRYGLGSPGKTGELPLAPALLHEVQAVGARWNIAPTQVVAAVVSDRDGVRSAWLRWGLIPSWAKDPSIGQRMINARSETVHEKPAFRTALRARRCLVLADLFYEWQAVAESDKKPRKQPWCVRLHNNMPFAFAGLWETWVDRATGEPVESVTLLTTAANSLMARIHDRMPVILPSDGYTTWLDQAAPVNTVRELLTPFDATAMQAWRVSTHVNTPSNDDAECVAPLDS